MYVDNLTSDKNQMAEGLYLYRQIISLSKSLNLSSVVQIIRNLKLRKCTL